VNKITPSRGIPEGMFKRANLPDNGTTVSAALAGKKHVIEKSIAQIDNRIR
jgi:hypothetical protein